MKFLDKHEKSIDLKTKPDFKCKYKYNQYVIGWYYNFMMLCCNLCVYITFKNFYNFNYLQ